MESARFEGREVSRRTAEDNWMFGCSLYSQSRVTVRNASGLTFTRFYRKDYEHSFVEKVIKWNVCRRS
ncbi:unnamed protein product [Pleuronectes platessa]|uniref:Uncharacterized protein n=1 Tax=Pleuronectes platessa TaxID=8262 RepID=A0A9N7YXJ8_PLEPL|nr:unnamed protein product [Pleuronectes platessa]